MTDLRKLARDRICQRISGMGYFGKLRYGVLDMVFQSKYPKGAKCRAKNCSALVVTKWLCDKHYRRLKRHGSPEVRLSRRSPLTLRERLDLGAKRAPGGCLEWQKGLLTDGYGGLKWEGRSRPVHRLAWQDKYGAVPSSVFICHRCDNPKCLELSHLYAGTPKDNARDSVVRGRRNPAFGKRHWNFKHGMYVDGNRPSRRKP